ncbi:MAG: lasso peptide biosynthesis B2 protein [Steroidobacteraceae bacterium]
MFLDLTRDRYVSVPLPRFAGLGAEIYGWHLPPDTSRSKSTEIATPGVAEELIAAGILRRRQADLSLPQRPTLKAERDCKAYTEFHSTLRPSPDHARVLSALIWADCALRNCTLFQVVQRMTAHRSRKCHAFSPDSQGSVERLVSRFLRTRPWYPRNYLCLFDSVALLRYLCSYQLHANWIFGVREDPFAAHCWLQYGTVILNDYLERTCIYTPIMII